MNRWRLGAALLCAVTGGAALSLQPRGAAQAQATVAWLPDFTQGAARARKDGKPLFVAFRCER